MTFAKRALRRSRSASASASDCVVDRIVSKRDSRSALYCSFFALLFPLEHACQAHRQLLAVQDDLRCSFIFPQDVQGLLLTGFDLLLHFDCPSALDRRVHSIKDVPVHSISSGCHYRATRGLIRSKACRACIRTGFLACRRQNGCPPMV